MPLAYTTKHLARTSEVYSESRASAGAAALLHPSRIRGKAVDGLNQAANKAKIDWTIEQLDIRRYEHILEVDCGPGDTIHELAGQLEVGLVAGVEKSVELYQRAHKRNKKFIRRELVELHPTSAIQLPYPSQYFHTVYTSSMELFRDHPVVLLERYVRLLKSGGKLVLVFTLHPSIGQQQIDSALDHFRDVFSEAGFINFQAERRAMPPLDGLAIIGFKP